MNILKWELKRGFKSLIIWILFIVGIQFMYSALFPSFAGENSLFSSKLQLLPKAFLKIFGVDRIDFSDILHFFAMQGQIWIFLFATFYLTRLSSSIFVKEEHDKTIEFLLSRPISRDRYIVEKFLSFTVFLVLYDGIITLSLLALFNKYKVKPFDIQLFWKIVIYYWAVHIFMSTVGIVFSVVSRKRTVADTGTFFVLGFSYVLALIARVYEKYNYLKNFTPFGIFDPTDLIKGSSANTFYISAFFVVLSIYLGSLIFSLYYYRMKDIYI
ncbi:MAG: ABC transporter permease subunit [Fervidobacterium sp.]